MHLQLLSLFQTSPVGQCHIYSCCHCSRLHLLDNVTSTVVVTVPDFTYWTMSHLQLLSLFQTSPVGQCHIYSCCHCSRLHLLDNVTSTVVVTVPDFTCWTMSHLQLLSLFQTSPIGQCHIYSCCHCSRLHLLDNVTSTVVVTVPDFTCWTMSRLLQLLSQTRSDGDVCQKTQTVVTSLLEMLKGKDVHAVWMQLSKLVSSLIGNQHHFFLISTLQFNILPRLFIT